MNHGSKYLIVRDNSKPASTQEFDLVEVHDANPLVSDESWEEDDFERAPTLDYVQKQKAAV